METMATGTTVTDAYREVVREQGAWTARLEKRVLARLACALPDAVTPDHLTALGSWACCWRASPTRWSGRNPLFLLAVVTSDCSSTGSATAWTAPSRAIAAALRPRYGFYVDHVIDAFGATAVLAGLALLAPMAPAWRPAVLVPYLLFSVHLYLQTHVLGRFRMSSRADRRDRAAPPLAVMNMAASPGRCRRGRVHRCGCSTRRRRGALRSGLRAGRVGRATTVELYRLERV